MEQVHLHDLHYFLSIVLEQEDPQFDPLVKEKIDQSLVVGGSLF